jgi:hypothetical protein
MIHSIADGDDVSKCRDLRLMILKHRCWYCRLKALTSDVASTVSSTPHSSRFGSLTHSLRAKVKTAQQKKKIVMLVRTGAVLPEAAGIVRISNCSKNNPLEQRRQLHRIGIARSNLAAAWQSS